MKKITNTLIASISLLLLISCNSSRTPHDNEPDEPEVKTLEERQYDELSKYTVKKDVKCSALKDAKQFYYADNFVLTMLTNGGKVYSVQLSGGLYSNNENCIEWESTRGKYVDWIYALTYSELRFNIDGKFYKQKSWSDTELVIAEDSASLVKKQNLYGKYMFLGSRYIMNKSIIYYDSEKKAYAELPIVGMVDNEVIEKYIIKTRQSLLITNMAVYTYDYEINEAECRKYIDIECIPGFSRSEILTHLLSDFNAIKIYFDGNVFIDKKGDLYLLAAQYSN